MEIYVIAFIVVGSVAVAFMILSSLCSQKKKSRSTPNPITRSVTTPSAPRSYPVDVERGQESKNTSGTKDGGMVILAGAGGALASADVITGVNGDCGGTGGGGGGGDGGGGDSGGGDGGGGGACGGCGGGCGGD